jgi:hypothetical protein
MAPQDTRGERRLVEDLRRLGLVLDDRRLPATERLRRLLGDPLTDRLLSSLSTGPTSGNRSTERERKTG